MRWCCGSVARGCQRGTAAWLDRDLRTDAVGVLDRMDRPGLDPDAAEDAVERLLVDLCVRVARPVRLLRP